LNRHRFGTLPTCSWKCPKEIELSCSFFRKGGLCGTCPEPVTIQYLQSAGLAHRLHVMAAVSLEQVYTVHRHTCICRRHAFNYMTACVIVSGCLRAVRYTKTCLACTLFGQISIIHTEWYNLCLPFRDGVIYWCQRLASLIVCVSIITFIIM